MAIIVIHSKTIEKVFGTYCMEWSVHYGHRMPDGSINLTSMLVSKEKALKLIEKHGLVECHRTKDGEIYDTPHREFKALFPNGIRSRYDMQQIEKTDRL